MSAISGKNLFIPAALLICFILPAAGGRIFAQNTDQTAARSENIKDTDVYNIRPLFDFRDKLIDWRKEKNDLYRPFEYSLEATVDNHGYLVVSGFPVFKGESQTQEIVKSAVAALSDSGLLKILSGAETKSVKILFTQDGKQFNCKFETAHDSEKLANRLAVALNLTVAVMKKQNEANDEASKLLQLVNIHNAGKTVIMNMTAPNQLAEAFLQKCDTEENLK
jgi:hypothetical protein